MVTKIKNPAIIKATIAAIRHRVNAACIFNNPSWEQSEAVIGDGFSVDAVVRLSVDVVVRFSVDAVVRFSVDVVVRSTKTKNTSFSITSEILSYVVQCR